MAAYLTDLAPRLEEVKDEIRELWQAYRTAFQGAGHSRIPEILSWLHTGFEMFLRFQVRMRVISPASKKLTISLTHGIMLM